MFCRKCGQEVKQGAKFCMKCGEPIIQQTVVKPTDTQKAKRKTGILAASMIAVVLLVLCLILGVFIFLEKNRVSDANDRDYERQERTDDEQSEKVPKMEEESTQVMLSTESESDDTVQKQSMSPEQFMADFPMCDINGAQYGFQKQASLGIYTTDGLRGIQGCLYYDTADLDLDGEKEIFAFWIRENKEDGNDILIRVYENKNEGYEIADEAIVLEGVLGRYSDSADIRFLLKDNAYIGVDSAGYTYLAADGVTMNMRMYGYDGKQLKKYIAESVSGSDFYGSGINHTDTIQDLENMGLYKSADNIRLRDEYSFCIADVGLESVAKIWVENSYRYSENSSRQPDPVATCHWIPADAGEYVLENSAVEYIAERDIKALNAEQLRIARNEIYARYGWNFEDEGLKRYFNEKSWYMPGSQIEEEQLSEIEVFNRDLIQSMEEK